jgi:hypothetical protein
MKKRTNCLFFALRLKMKKGGKIYWRRARAPWTIGYHWIWTDGKRIIHCEPLWSSKDKTLTQAFFHKIWYYGRIRRYDAEWGSNKTTNNDFK